MIVVLAFSSCQDYLDINDDEHRIREVQFEILLPTVIERTSAAHYSVARSSGLVTQQIGYNSGGYPTSVSSGAWSTIYLHAMANCREMIENSEKAEAYHFTGIGQILMAMNLGLLADNWENAPYTEALNGEDEFTPAFDSQENLYNSINDLLDNAIINLQKENNPKHKVGSTDMAFGGAIDKWMKVAYSLKARTALHLSHKGLDNATVLGFLDKAMSSNEDDLQLYYNEVNNNPWHIIAKNNATGNYSVAIGGYLIALLQDSTKTVADPRLEVIAGPGDGVRYGVSYADSPYGSADHNTPFKKTETWLSNINSPIQFITYAETKFIEAEVAFPTDRGRAYAAYLDGIAANIAKMGIDGSAYLADPGVDVGEANLTLSHIMKEKYIATYLMPETWVDMRRYQYDSDIYSGFVTPVPDSTILDPLQRFEYPTSEFSRNEAEVNKAVKGNTEIMWRDL